ncbi:MAG TPA: YceI family protein [Bacteroidales bacterium]|nr:YceI family protein [Bacteroidales bacterium]
MSTKTIWSIDPSHSEITFKVKHLMISNVKGEFRTFSGSVETLNNDFSNARATVEIDTASIFTNNDDRDNHLRSADFFDVANHPVIRFSSTAFIPSSDDEFELKGMLNMHGMEKEISLKAEFGGITKDPWGREKAGFSISGSINRKDWGLNWNAALEAGGVLVGEEVKILAEVQLVKA